jgi:hypothetical protein
MNGNNGSATSHWANESPTLACAQPIGNVTVGLYLGSVATKPLSGVGGKLGE